MAITTAFKTRMANVSKQYNKASLIKTSNKATHNPPEDEVYATKSVGWNNASAGKIKSSSIVFPDIPPGAETDMIVLKADKVWINGAPADNVDERYEDFYDVFIANKTAGNVVSHVGWHKGSTRDYPFLLIDVEIEALIENDTLTVTVPDGVGSTWSLNDFYEALFLDTQATWLTNVTTATSVKRIVFGSSNGPEKIMTARHMFYLSECAYIKQKHSTASVDLNAFKIAYDLDDHKGDNSLDFTKKGSIVTNIEREYEEL